ncbi:beta-ketoacyl-[acyl-carrier-protein] synthase II [Mycolicibacterium elephantis]|uniref:Beta-ketoacyl-[acyl-carrier-protein] synthase II n=1 Tax=Mycolicibacterium elephantis TaxID=81858 RepID=A0A1X0D8Y6_9MYCO|nr:KasA/KasB family beta-ketoacyl-ACP synthase [Mycolicibacterium elephantis]ORA68864.1 beta-ketoacyl-[acyl-carrier-protein] synthase II [Mycolicibacterium elephantis]
MTTLSTGDRFPEVVVTAVSATTPLAPDAEQTWQQLLQGESGIRALDKWFVGEYESPVKIGGQLREDFDEQLNRVEKRRMAFMQKMSTLLGRRLWEIAGSPEVDTRRLMVSVGLALGSTEEIPAQYDAWKQKGLRAVSPLAVQMYMPNAAAAALGLDHQAKAGILSPVMADASGSAAVAQAWRHIVFGDADVAICGGVETEIEAVPIAAFMQQGIMSTNTADPAGACRPFDKNRDGMVLGEGGALLLLERAEHAKARGARVLARLMGAAMTSDGYDAIEIDASGERAGDAISRAIEVAGLSPTDIDHINAHACGIPVGDLAEARAIHRALGTHRPAVYAPKAALGHSLGAAGAVEAVLTVKTLSEGVIPATRNYAEPDPEIDLDVVAGSPRRGDYRYAISTSFGFGGYNVALVFGAP